MDTSSLQKAIYYQKEERERLLSLCYFPRHADIQKEALVASPLAKVILGPRRAGKSLFAFNLLRGNDFAYLNFDTDQLVLPFSHDDILESTRLVYGDTKFVLLDEIQNLTSWELFVNMLERRGYNVVLTGSNANLLSRELATALTGRHIPVEILPFSFLEYCGCVSVTPSYIAYMQYMTLGGFPEVLFGGVDVSSYISTLTDAVLYRDITSRYRIKKQKELERLFNHTLAETGSCHTIRSLSRTISDQENSGAVISHVTTQKFCSYLEEAFLLFFLSRFSFKSKERVQALYKPYPVDIGLYVGDTIRFSADHGKLLELFVFLELVKSGNRLNRDFFFYQTKNRKEVDFVIRKGLKTTKLIQVCHHLTEVNRKREIGALIEASEELLCDALVIVTDVEERTITEKGKKIHVIPAWKFAKGLVK